MPQIQSGAIRLARMKLDIGGVERQAASTSSYAYRLTQINFTYTVVAADVDADGIAIPANSIIGSDNWSKVGGGFVDRSHGALSDQSAHRVFGAPAYISATNPASLTEANLNGATVTVSLGGLTFASGVSASSFQLVTSPAISGLSVSNVTGGASGSTSATLTLATASGFDFDTPATLAVRVLAAAHSGSTDATTGGTVPLTPTDEAPSFGSGSVPAKTFFRDRAIAEFQIPAATGGNGTLSYTASGLPAGLVFDADGTGSCPGTEPREVCGTPTAATRGARTVTVTAQGRGREREPDRRGPGHADVPGHGARQSHRGGQPRAVAYAAARSMIQRRLDPTGTGEPRRGPARPDPDRPPLGATRRGAAHAS